MTVRWIGTRTQDDGAFCPEGLGRASAPHEIDTTLLARGSLLIEAEISPSQDPVNLVRFAALNPWASGLTVCLEPDGTLRLMMRQGTRHLETALKTGIAMAAVTAHITFTWDAPARCGNLSLYLPDYGRIWRVSVMQPFPLAMRDAQRMMCAPDVCAMDKGVVFAAIADAPCPLGPVPGLSGTAAVDTPQGQKLLRDIVAGDLVNTMGTRPKRVLWSGAATLPALGRFAPVTLRQPYMGLWEDLLTTRDQRVCMAGSEVEYLFGEERVSTAVRHLEARNCATPTRHFPAVMTYHQILLDTHEIITVNGATVESFDASAVLDDPAALQTSVLADMPQEARPRQIGLAAPVLRGFEALTLSGVSIG